MAGLSDILSTAQNIVTAINGAFDTYQKVQGKSRRADISTATLVNQGAGRLANVVVTTAGTTPGSVYDGNTATVTTNKLYSIPNTVGVVVVNMPVSTGIVVAPGTGQVVAVSYS